MAAEWTDDIIEGIPKRIHFREIEDAIDRRYTYATYGTSDYGLNPYKADQSNPFVTEDADYLMSECSVQRHSLNFEGPLGGYAGAITIPEVHTCEMTNWPYGEFWRSYEVRSLGFTNGKLKLPTYAFGSQVNPKFKYYLQSASGEVIRLSRIQGVYEWDRCGYDLEDSPVIQWAISEMELSSPLDAFGKQDCCSLFNDGTRFWNRVNLAAGDAIDAGAASGGRYVDIPVSNTSGFAYPGNVRISNARNYNGQFGIVSVSSTHIRIFKTGSFVAETFSGSETICKYQRSYYWDEEEHDAQNGWYAMGGYYWEDSYWLCEIERGLFGTEQGSLDEGVRLIPYHIGVKGFGGLHSQLINLLGSKKWIDINDGDKQWVGGYVKPSESATKKNIYEELRDTSTLYVHSTAMYGVSARKINIYKYTMGTSKTVDITGEPIDNGSNTVKIPVNNANLLVKPSDSITISGSANYDGTYTVSSVAVGYIVISHSYVEEQFGQGVSIVRAAKRDVPRGYVQRGDVVRVGGVGGLVGDIDYNTLKSSATYSNLGNNDYITLVVSVLTEEGNILTADLPEGTAITVYPMGFTQNWKGTGLNFALYGNSSGVDLESNTSGRYNFRADAIYEMRSFIELLTHFEAEFYGLTNRTALYDLQHYHSKWELDWNNLPDLSIYQPTFNYWKRYIVVTDDMYLPSGVTIENFARDYSPTVYLTPAIPRKWEGGFAVLSAKLITRLYGYYNRGADAPQSLGVKIEFPWEVHASPNITKPFFKVITINCQTRGDYSSAYYYVDDEWDLTQAIEVEPDQWDVPDGGIQEWLYNPAGASDQRVQLTISSPPEEKEYIYGTHGQSNHFHYKETNCRVNNRRENIGANQTEPYMPSFKFKIKVGLTVPYNGVN